MRQRSMMSTGLMAIVVLSCGDEADIPVPSAETVESYFEIPATSSVEILGNVAEMEVYQSAENLRRGGSLWAKVGPYVYLFSDATRQMFTEQPGIGGLRVITRAPGGAEVARATLARTALNEITWPRALNISGRARRDGTTRPVVLEELVNWGEDHTEFEYSSDYIRSP